MVQCHVHAAADLCGAICVSDAATPPWGPLGIAPHFNPQCDEQPKISHNLTINAPNAKRTLRGSVELLMSRLTQPKRR